MSSCSPDFLDYQYMIERSFYFVYSFILGAHPVVLRNDRNQTRDGCVQGKIPITVLLLFPDLSNSLKTA